MAFDREKIDELKTRLSDGSRELRDTAQEKAGKAREWAGEAKASLEDGMVDVRAKAVQTSSDAKDWAKEHPIAMIGAGLVAGALIGALVPKGTGRKTASRTGGFLARYGSEIAGLAMALSAGAREKASDAMAKGHDAAGKLAEQAREKLKRD